MGQWANVGYSRETKCSRDYHNGIYHCWAPARLLGVESGREGFIAFDCKVCVCL